MALNNNYKNNKMNVKQVILAVRGHMEPGKLSAQVAHAALVNILNLAHHTSEEEGMIFKTLSYEVNSDVHHWIENGFTKVVLAVDSKEEMLEIFEKAKKLNLNTSLIIDDGRTVFNGEKTITCVAIGPHKSELIDPLTRHLRMY